MASNVAPTSDFNPAATELITNTFRVMGVINEDEVPTAGQFANAMFRLNSMMKEWESDGIHIWTEEEGIVFLQQGQRTYLLGGTTTDKACDAMSWNQTQTQQAAGSGASAIVVVDPSGINVGDNFGVVLNTGAAYWSTVQSKVSNQINIAGSIPSPLSSGMPALSYPPSAQLTRPLQIPFCRRLQYQTQPGQVSVQAPDWGGIITSVSPMSSRQDYMDLPQPNNPGLVTQVFYNPARDQGQLWVWNVSTNALYGLRFTYYRPIRDFLYGNNTGDFPQEWINTLQWLLAEEMGPSYSVSPVRWKIIQTMAEQKHEKVMTWDREPQPIYFGRSSRFQR